MPGGGVGFIRAIKAVDAYTGADEEEKAGVRIVKRVLEEPLRGIAENAGWDGSVVVGKVSESKGPEGFDAGKLEYTNLIAAGIIDPAKVSRSAILNAASVAGLLLTTEALVAEKSMPEEAAGGGMPGGMGGMGGGPPQVGGMMGGMGTGMM